MAPGLSLPKLRRTQAERAATARARLIGAAIQVFSERGSAGASLQLIASVAGLSKSAAAHHFPTKASLHRAIVEHVWLRNREALGLATDSEPAWPSGLQGFLEVAWHAYKAPYSMASLEVLLAGRGDPDASSKYAEITMLAREQYLQRFRAELENEHCPTDNAEAFYTLGISVFRGLAVEGALNPRPFIEDVARSFIQLASQPKFYAIAVSRESGNAKDNPVVDDRQSDTKLRLIHAAIESLYRQGYSNTSLTVVAERVGVSKSTALHHFKDKIELMEGVLQYSWSLNHADYTNAVLKAIDVSPLRAFGEAAWSMYRLPRNLAELEIWLAGRSEQLLKDRIIQKGEAIAAQTESDFTTVYKSAKLPPEDAPTAYALSLAALRGLAIERAMASNPMADSAAAIFLEALERGYIKRA